jgi:hypothetical protein
VLGGLSPYRTSCGFVAIPLSGKRVERIRPAAVKDLPGKSFGGDIRDVKC